MAKKLTAREKLNRKREPKKVCLDHNFAGLKAGSKMFVATPQIVNSYIKAIPYGESRLIPDMRAELAQAHSCDGTCPASTSIFIRMVAEAALEDINEGIAMEAVAPFWRLITAKDKITKKLNVDPQWVDDQRALEIQ